MSDQTVAWLTIEEAATLIRVPKSWLYERTRTNTVPHIKLGKYVRFDRQELLNWVQRFRRDGRGRRVQAARSAMVAQSSRSRRPSLG
jgi:excisionase family DNA binding protein